MKSEDHKIPLSVHEICIKKVIILTMIAFTGAVVIVYNKKSKLKEVQKWNQVEKVF